MKLIVIFLMLIFSYVSSTSAFFYSSETPAKLSLGTFIHSIPKTDTRAESSGVTLHASMDKTPMISLTSYISITGWKGPNNLDMSITELGFGMPLKLGIKLLPFLGLSTAKSGNLTGSAILAGLYSDFSFGSKLKLVLGLKANLYKDNQHLYGTWAWIQYQIISKLWVQLGLNGYSLTNYNATGGGLGLLYSF